MKTEITPTLNTEITNNALKAMAASGKNDKKSFNAEYNKAIKSAGFSPAYFKKVMSNLGPEY